MVAADTLAIMRRIAIPFLLLAVSAASPALAAGPQKGRYQCWFPNGFFAADLHIVSATKYRVEDETGKYAVRGKRLRIKSGPHKGLWKSVTWSTKPDLNGKPRTAILFHPKEEGESLLQCVRA
jgi:hypothetical protein